MSASAQPRRLHLGAFMRPVSIHTGAWRYPGSVPGRQLQFRTSETVCADARARQVRCLLHGRSPGRSEHADGCIEAQWDGDIIRADDFAVCAGCRDRPHRSHCDRIDNLRRALSRCPALRLTRSHQPGPCCLERRNDIQPGCLAELRSIRADGTRRALPPRPRILRRRHGPLGQLGRRRFRPRRRRRHFLRSCAASCAGPTVASISTSAVRSTLAVRCRAGR